VLDVDKPVKRPSIVEPAEAIEAVRGVEGPNITVTEIDIETIGTEVTVEGTGLDEYRSELVLHARQPNLLEHGGLASTALGRAVLADATSNGVVAGLASFVGAFAPLALAAAVPNAPWLAFVAAIAVPAALGVGLARIVEGRVLVWPGARAQRLPAHRDRDPAADRLGCARLAPLLGYDQAMKLAFDRASRR
jgi:hypothetical protein